MGEHRLTDDALDRPMAAVEAIDVPRTGLAAGRNGLGQLTDVDLSTVAAAPARTAWTPTCG